MTLINDRADYRKEIDGLRALAILGVIFFHLGFQSPLSSYLGVDVFFVISGFLISGILYHSISNGTFSFFDFWFRRVKRLFPCFVCVSLGTSLFASTILLSSEWNALSKQIVASTFFVSNHLTLLTIGNYWGQLAETTPFLHFWSLSIEEQFYLLFPALLLVSSRVLRSARQFAIFFSFLAISSLFTAYFLNPKYPTQCFYLLPTRAWELLLGVISFFLREQLKPRISLRSWWLPSLGFSIIILAFHASNSASGYSLKLGLATCIATSLCCIFEPSSKSAIGFLLTNGLSTLIGRLSYSLYLWHWPVIVFMKFAGIEYPLFSLPIIVLLSLASHYLVENPFRRTSVRNFRRCMPVFTILLLASIFAPNLIPRDSISYSLPRFESGINLAPKYGPGRYGGETGTFRSGLQVRLTSQNRPKVLLLGDSHSLMFFPAIAKAADTLDTDLTFFGADGGTSPFLVGNDLPSEHYFDGWSDKERIEFDHCRVQFIKDSRPSIIVICANWTSYYDRWGDEKFGDKLHQLLRTCPEARFLLIEQPPILPFGSEGFNSGLLEQPLFRAFKEEASSKKNRMLANRKTREVAQMYEKAYVCSVDEIFESGEALRFHDGGILFYKDDDHLSISGSHLCDEIITSAIERLLPLNSSQ